MAADHLLGLGHRTIGHLTGTREPAAPRREGFTSRLAEAGLTPRGWATPDNQIARLRQSVARTVRDLHSPRAARPKHLTTEAMSPFHGAFEARRDPAQSRQARRTRNAALPGAVTGIISNEDRKKSDTMVPSFASSAKARFVTSPPGSATMPGNQPPHRPNLAVGRTDPEPWHQIRAPRSPEPEPPTVPATRKSNPRKVEQAPARHDGRAPSQPRSRNHCKASNLDATRPSQRSARKTEVSARLAPCLREVIPDDRRRLVGRRQRFDKFRCHVQVVRDDFRWV